MKTRRAGRRHQRTANRADCDFARELAEDFLTQRPSAQLGRVLRGEDLAAFLLRFANNGTWTGRNVADERRARNVYMRRLFDTLQAAGGEDSAEDRIGGVAQEFGVSDSTVRHAVYRRRKT